MNKNYTDQMEELSKQKTTFSQLRSAFLSPKFLIYSAIIILLLLISEIIKL